MKRYLQRYLVRLDITRIFQLFQLSRFGGVFLIGMILARSSFLLAQIGEYESLLFWAGASTFFWVNGTLQGLLPLATERKIETDRLLTTVLIGLLGLAGIACLVWFVLWQSGLFSSWLTFSPGLLMLYIGLMAPGSLIEFIFLIRKERRNLLLLTVVLPLVHILLVLIIVYYGWGMQRVLYSFIFIAGVRLVLVFLSLPVNFVQSFDGKLALRLFSRASPLIIAMLLSGSAQYVDGWLVVARYDASLFAIFRFGARELPLVMLLANGFSNAILSQFGGNGLKQNQRNLQLIGSRSRNLMNFLFPVTGILLLVSHQLFPLVFGARFADSATIFNIYLLLIIPRLLFPQTILTGLGYGAVIMRAAFFELVLNVGLSLCFIRLWGMQGVAYATVIAYLFEKLFLSWSLYKMEGVGPNIYIPWKRLLIFSVGLLTLFLIVENIYA